MPQSPKNKWILYLILVVLFIYWYAAFHVDYLPLHSFFQDFSSNYDNYASKAIGYVPLIIALIIALSFFLRSIKKDFLKLQSTLPTSKIQSLAKGLVEVEGKLIMGKPLVSPVGHELCIGYYYEIEEITTDDKERESYKTIHRETKCNVFEIQDDTGKIRVQPDGIKFILLEKTNIVNNSSRRYSEILLQENQEMLLVGYADTENGENFIRIDDYYKVLGITSSAGISVWNKFQPLLSSFLFTCFMIISVIIFILIQ